MIMNPNEQFCSFCLSIGIEGPHNHFMREKKEMGGKTICPKLLNTCCTYCKRMGHTDKYCGLKREEESVNKKKTSEIWREKVNAGKVWSNNVKAVKKNTISRPIINKNNQGNGNCINGSMFNILTCEPDENTFQLKFKKWSEDYDDDDDSFLLDEPFFGYAEYSYP